MQSNILIIVPAYNEELNIVRVVNDLIINYPQYDYVVINDGSTDRTAQICRERGFNLVDMPVNLGLAGAFQAGMKYAAYRNYCYAIQYDGDGQHNPEYIEKMYQTALQNGYDIVIGSRFVNEKMPWTLRMLGSRLLRVGIWLTTWKWIKDPTSGMRMYNRRTIQKLARQMNYGPEPDTIAYLVRCGLKIGECQVHMNERMAGESYLNIGSSIVYMVKMLGSILLVGWFRGRMH